MRTFECHSRCTQSLTLAVCDCRHLCCTASPPPPLCSCPLPVIACQINVPPVQPSAKNFLATLSPCSRWSSPMLLHLHQDPHPPQPLWSCFAIVFQCSHYSPSLLFLCLHYFFFSLSCFPHILFSLAVPPQQFCLPRPFPKGDDISHPSIPVGPSLPVCVCVCPSSN